jgi:glutamine amidotransferase
MIIIVDYNCGNLGSIKNMLYKIGAPAEISNDLNVIAEASKIILPGVGSFDYGMVTLQELGLKNVLDEKKKAGIPILGICLGAQLMCNQSEEGKLKGLSWVDADVHRFPNEVDNKRYPVPHIGWDIVKPLKKTRIFHEMPEDSRFYFVHSYHIKCYRPDDALAKNHYVTEFHSAFEADNVIGVQFHPEKSHKFGKQLLKNFVTLY